MNGNRVIMVAVVVALALGVQVANAAPVALPDGTPIALQLVDGLKSGRERTADRVSLIVRDTGLGPNGEILVANGAKAEGTVTRSKDAKMLGRAGKIDFTVDYVTAVDGTQIPVRAIARKRGQKLTDVGVGAGIVIAWPLAFIKGQNTTFPPGFEFTAYVDGDHEVDLAVGAGGVKPLVVRDFAVMAAGRNGALAAFTVENPNAGLALRNALVDITAYNADGDVIGSNGSMVKLDPAHTLWSLLPAETRTVVKRLQVSKSPDEVAIHVAQPWQQSGEATPPPAKVSVLFSEWRGEAEITGLVRNDDGSPARVELAAVVREEGEIRAVGRAGIGRLQPGKSKRFTINMVGEFASDAEYEISAVGSTEAAAR